MKVEVPPPCAYSFGDGFTLSMRPLKLEKSGRNLGMRNRALRLLALLVERRGDLVTQADIKQTLWPDREVDVARGVHVCIREIRQALGDDPESPIFIETIPRQGYRFIGDCESVDPAPLTKAESSKTSLLRNTKIIAGGAALLGVVFVSITIFLNQRTFSPEGPNGSTTSLAREYYDKGKYLLDVGGSDNVLKAAEYFGEAVGRDSKFAPAYFGLAEVAIQRGDMTNARAQVEKGAAADPNSPLPHLYFGRLAIWGEWNWDKAENELRAFLRAQPDSGKGHMMLGWLAIIRGNPEEAIKEAQIAYRVDPVSTLVRAGYGEIHYYSGDYETALKFCSEADALSSSSRSGCVLNSAAALARWALAAKAAEDLARSFWEDEELAAHIRALPPKEGLKAYYAALFEKAKGQDSIWKTTRLNLYKFSETGDDSYALAALQEGFQTHYSLFPILIRDPAFAALRGRPEYNEILVGMGLEPYPAEPDKLTERNKD